MTASAQDTTRARSQRRIPVRKEQPAPQPVRVDTVTITRTDTVVRTRTDTVTVTRVDTVTRIEELPLQRLPGWQFGLATGLDIPTGAWLQSNRLGWTGHAHLGWFPGTSPVGIRSMVITATSAHRIGARTAARRRCGSCRESSCGVSRSIGRARSIRRSTSSAAAVSIGSTTSFRIEPERSHDRERQAARPSRRERFRRVFRSPSSRRTSGGTFGHWSLGGGVQLGGFFIESQYKSINTNNGNSNHVPVLVGWNWNF